jgi:hypothetical protein
MRAFFYSCGLLGIAMWLDVAYCNGKFGQAAVQNVYRAGAGYEADWLTSQIAPLPILYFVVGADRADQ